MTDVGFPRWPRVVLAASLVLGSTACAPADDEQEVAEAFPNRRPAFLSRSKLLGYVSNRSSDTISVIDLERMKLLGEAPIGRDPVDIDGPSPLALDVKRGIAYVALGYPGSVVGVHEQIAGAKGRNGYVLALDLDDLAPLAEVRVELEPRNVAYDSKLDQIAVSHSDSARALNLIGELQERRANVGLISGKEMSSGKPPKPNFISTCVMPTSLAYGAPSERLYVVCTGENGIAFIDTKDATVAGYGPAGSAGTQKPGSIVVAEQGLLISNELAHAVAWWSQDTEPVLQAEVRVQGSPRYGLFTGKSEALVPMQDPDGLSRVDLKAASVSQERLYVAEECQKPGSLNQGPEGELWLVCEGDHFAPGWLVSLEPETLEILDRVPLGSFPSRMAVLQPKAK
jgi:DNA-binding beta-propeller fold protein YncE